MAAETEFRNAFQRLKVDAPRLLAKGTAVTQNNVAREAGVDPSALKKSRYPQLIFEIQQWIKDNPDLNQITKNSATKLQKRKNRDLRDQLKELTLQRDHAISMLTDADLLILKLTKENQQLQRELLENTNIHILKSQ